jgi:hypothetical protein
MAALDDEMLDRGRHLDLEIEDLLLPFSIRLRPPAGRLRGPGFFGPIARARPQNADPKIARLAPKFERRRLSAAQSARADRFAASTRKTETPFANAHGARQVGPSLRWGERHYGRQLRTAPIFMRFLYCWTSISLEDLCDKRHFGTARLSELDADQCIGGKEACSKGACSSA